MGFSNSERSKNLRFNGIFGTNIKDRYETKTDSIADLKKKDQPRQRQRKG